MPQPEARLTGKILDHIKGLPSGYARKVHGGNFGNAGEPDVDACIGGRAVKIEVKMPGRKPTELQYASLRRWQRAGALCGWVTSVEEAKDLLTHLHEPFWTNPQL